jgi:hypothetical protein
MGRSGMLTAVLKMSAEINESATRYAKAALVDLEDQQAELLAVLDDLACAADTAELMLRKDYEGEAASLREKVSKAIVLLKKLKGPRR